MFLIILLIVSFYILITQFYIYFKGVISHPILSLKYIPRDIYLYIHHKEYNKCKNYGYLNLYSAYSNQVFGCGKTLTMVKDALILYHKYDNKVIWSDHGFGWVTQHVHIISNIKLYGVNYYRFTDEYINIYHEVYI